MRIVVDTALNTGTAEYLNMGDVAMLQVGVRRLQSLWPSARVEVLTESPANLASFVLGQNPCREPEGISGSEITPSLGVSTGFCPRPRRLD